MKNEERVVIAGGGLAGLRAGERLRELGFRGEIVIVSAERHLPYHRPALSKEAINGELIATDLRLTISRELNAVWRLGTAATHLEQDRRVVGLPGGEELKYDGLIIATGVEPRHLAGAPRQDPRIHVLRTVDDAIAIKQAINSTQGLVVVIGGGLIGCEMTASVKMMGRDVAMVSRSSTLLGNAVGKNIADTVTEAHRVRGVRLAMGVKIRHWVRQSGGVAIHLSDGQVFFAAVVVIAVGASPSTAWLRGSGLNLEDGVLCDATCHAVGGSDIVAAGDVAKWPNLRFGGRPRRVEHWLHAVEMGRAAAENLLAGRENSRPFTPVPRFWTEQYGMRIQGSGHPAMGKDTTTLAGSQKDHRTITGFIDDGRLVGMVGLDAPTAMIKLSTELWRQNRVTAPEAQRPVPPHQAPVQAAAPTEAIAAPAAGPAQAPTRPEQPARPEEPTRYAPIRAELAHAELSRSEPGRSEQARPESVRTEPARAESVRAESMRFEAPPTESVRYEAPPTESVRYEAPRTESVRFESARFESARFEAPPVESVRFEAPRAASEHFEAPRVESFRFEAPPVESVRHEAPRSESFRFEAPPVESFRFEAPPVESVRYEAPRSEATRLEAPRAESVHFETSRTEPMRSEAPHNGSRRYEEPRSERFEAVRSEAMRLESALLAEAARFEARAEAARAETARAEAAARSGSGRSGSGPTHTQFSDPVELARVPRQQQESQPLPIPPSHAPVVRSRGHSRSLTRTGPKARARPR